MRQTGKRGRKATSLPVRFVHAGKLCKGEKMVELQGYIDRIVFRNEENGYSVLCMKEGNKEEFLVGVFPDVSEGEYLTARGEMNVHPIYGKQLRVQEYEFTAPIETWSDDFSIAIAGIPSMVNDFTGGSFMETNYHSQFDNDGFYDEDVYRMHHELFGLLLMAIDRTVVVPLDFSRVFRKARERLDSEWCEKTGADGQRLLRVLEQATATAQQLYAKVEKTNRNARHADASAAGVENASGLCTAETGDAGAVNGDFTTCVQGTDTAAEVPAADTRKLERSLLQVFQQEQDTYVRIDWYGNVLFPHGILQDRLQLLEGAVRNLKEGRLSAALRKLYEIDSNRYAFLFEEEVYRHFTSYALDQSADRLKWGTGRIIGFENFFSVVTGLLEKEKMGCSDFTEEIAQLEAAYERQSDLYRKEIDTLCVQTERMERLLREAGVEFYGQ